MAGRSQRGLSRDVTRPLCPWCGGWVAVGDRGEMVLWVTEDSPLSRRVTADVEGMQQS